MDAAYFMSKAIELARLAYDEGEVPVGCVVVRDGVVIGRGWNRREGERSALAHAEMEAIAEACRALNSWRLSGCDLYVTLEPCPMCAGAMLNARISRLYYGAADEKGGACGGVLNLFMEDFGHKPQIYGRIMEEECSRLLSGFFAELRKRCE
jgi:tRNA(adenine34) deaminase